MSLLMHVVAHVPQYFIFDTILPFRSLLSARVLKFGLFSSHVVAYIVSFDSRFETWKSDMIRPRYELINACGGSCPSVLYLWPYITFSFTPLSTSFGFLDFFIPCRSLHRKLWFKIWNSKSDIIRPHYELFHACCGSCPSLPCLSHYITFSFIPLSSSFGIGNFSSHVVAYIVSFDPRF